MNNPIINHCFDKDLNIKADIVTTLFKNPNGKEDFDSSKRTMFKVLSKMPLTDEFMIKHFKELDLVQLIINKTLTNVVFKERIEDIYQFIKSSEISTMDDRFNLVKMYMTINMNHSELEESVLTFFYNMKYYIDGFYHAQSLTDQELDETELVLTYTVNNLFLQSFYKVFLETKAGNVQSCIFGASAILYHVCNDDAGDVENLEYLGITETDVVQAIVVFDVIIGVNIYRKRLFKLMDVFDIHLSE